MKKIVALAVSMTMLSSVSNAWIIKGKNSQPEPSPYITVGECSRSLYSQLGTYESSTDVACMQGRTDYEFQACAVDLSKKRFPGRGIEIAGYFCAKGEMNPRTQDCTLSLQKYFDSVSTEPEFDSRSYALYLCQGSVSSGYSKCVIDLYSRGGQEVENINLSTDANRLCRNGTNEELNKCIISSYNNERMSGAQAARICLEKHDPVAKARREAELRRIEEEKRRAEAERRVAEQRAAEQRAAAQKAAEQKAAEQRRQEELRRQEEQRRQSDQQRTQDQKRLDEQKRQEELKRQQDEQKKKDEEQRKRDEEKKKQEEQKQKPSNPPTGASGGGGGGVIVDLPNFE